MASGIDLGRRRLIGSAAVACGAACVGLFRTADSYGAPRELAALAGANGWLTPRLTLAELTGRVVLVQFWTYTCINWLRTLAHLRAWADTYSHELTIVGVHTPEFSFEHDAANVRRAVQRLKINYPVVMDNDFAIWRAFDNSAWPALYLLDERGRIRHTHLGEGNFEQSELAIQRLLAARAGAGVRRRAIVSVQGTGIEAAADWSNLRSPENYLGYERTEGFASPGGARREQRYTYAAPARLSLNQWALAGDWTFGRQAPVLNAPGGLLVSQFHARDLHLVVGPSRPEHPVRFRVSVDGRPPGAAHGDDVDTEGNGTVGEQRLFQLVRQPPPIVDRRVDIEFLDAGVAPFAFTFG